jgi:hypothetical protein
MKTVVKRIRAIARDVGIGEGNFEKSLNISRGYLNITDKRNGDPGLSVVQKLVEEYPEYSLKWIFTGKGSMKLEKHGVVEEPEPNYASGDSIEHQIIKLIKGVIHDDVSPKLETLSRSVDDLMNKEEALKRDVIKLKELNKS